MFSLKHCFHTVFSEKMVLYVTDVTGKVLLNSSQQSSEMSVDLSDFDSGVYFLNIFIQLSLK